ncbi:MAG TPA: hypothetical protein VN030_02090 [Cellvibrio sp.]|nr:hypothetical protein [Cellvibrio sp.]
MKNLAATIIAGFLLVFQGYALAGGIVDDVKQVRQSNREAVIDISDIAKKYISLASAKNSVEDYLQAQKFALHNQPMALDGSQTLIAVYAEKRLLDFGFHDEIRVVVVFVNDKVVRVNGKLIFRAL